MHFGHGYKELLNLSAHESLHRLWNAWITNTEFNELWRVDAIKGQHSTRNPLNLPDVPRQKVVSALKDLPIGSWVSITDFFKFIQVSGFELQVTLEPSWLYAGAGGKTFTHGFWSHINGRFTCAFLLEYAATLGVIDVALTLPWGSVDDVEKFNHTLTCFSRYDGLKYIRLTALGAWILGLVEGYESQVKKKTACLQILPNLEIVLLSERISPFDRVCLESICDKKSDRIWQLSKYKILSQLEYGIRIEDVEAKLKSLASIEQLPENLEIFLKDISKKSFQLSVRGSYTIVECEDSKTALMLVNDKELKKFTYLPNDRCLMVEKCKEGAFRKRIKKQGFVLPI